MIIDLLRHGALEGGKRYRGQVDDLLTAEGRHDMDRVWHKIKDRVEVIVTSPLKRCSLPAHAWGSDNDIPCITESWLREMHYGDWEGMSANEIEATYPGILKHWRRNPESVTVPNGEPLELFLSRIDKGWKNLTSNYQGKHLLIITHSGAMRALIAQALCESPPIVMRRLSMPYTCWSRIEFKDGTPSLTFHNHDSKIQC
ncbi:MAG: histidine phosphatase family protein [Mariprofundaceae bacterium]